jgi:LacI family transcriptional regulator
VRLAQGLGLSGYRELQAILQTGLSVREDQGLATQPLRLHLMVESGRSFNEATQRAAEAQAAREPGLRLTSALHLPHETDPESLAQALTEAAKTSDGIVLVAREHPAINHAVRAVVARGVPVICLTTDLPASGRTSYVGSDQYASGATAGWFCGRLLPRDREGQVLFICSVPFRCHLEREQGFRQVLRTDFPQLTIQDRVNSDETAEVVYQALRRYIAAHGAPAAIYNVSGANIGVGRALEDEGLAGKTVFIGHELNANSRTLLEKGVMDLAIGHDIQAEIALAVESIRTAQVGGQPVNRLTQSQLFTRYNCAIL